MTAKESWALVVEGIGPSHNGSTEDANYHAVKLLQKLKSLGHRFFQVRFSTGRGEENWRDSVTWDMHTELVKKADDKDPHQELVEMGVKANASEKQSSGKGDVRGEERKEHPGDTKEGRKRVYGGPEARLPQEPPRTEGTGKK